MNVSPFPDLFVRAEPVDGTIGVDRSSGPHVSDGDHDQVLPVADRSDAGVDGSADDALAGQALNPPWQWTCLADAAAYVGAAGSTRPDQVLEVPARELVDLYRRLETSPVIEEAKGIVMGYYGLTAATAFMVLQRWSQHGNTRLWAIAQALVDGVAGQPYGTVAPHDLAQRIVTARLDARMASEP